MKKLLTLSADQFLSGINQGGYGAQTGIFEVADGVRLHLDNVDHPDGTDFFDNDGSFSSITYNQITHGAIMPQHNLNVTDVETLDFTPLAYSTDVNGGNVRYVITPAGIARTSGGGVSYIYTAALDYNNGIELFQPKGGTRKVYYWQNNQIGSSIASFSSPNDAEFTGLENAPHPTHKMFDEVYYGNGSKVGLLKDDGAGGVTNQLNVLDLPADNTITSITDDGQSLVIAAKVGTNRAKVYFWDKASSSWQREHDLGDVNGQVGRSNHPIIFQAFNAILAITNRGVSIFDMYTTPQVIIKTNRRGSKYFLQNKDLQLATYAVTPEGVYIAGMDNNKDFVMFLYQRAGGGFATYNCCWNTYDLDASTESIDTIGIVHVSDDNVLLALSSNISTTTLIKQISQYSEEAGENDTEAVSRFVTVPFDMGESTRIDKVRVHFVPPKINGAAPSYVGNIEVGLFSTDETQDVGTKSREKYYPLDQTSGETTSIFDFYATGEKPVPSGFMRLAMKWGINARPVGVKKIEVFGEYLRPIKNV